MTDIAKWTLLGALIVSLIVMVLTLPFAQYLDIESLSQSVHVIVSCAGEFLYEVRGIINVFLPTVGRQILSGLITYLFLSWIIKLSIKIFTWIIHFILK